MLRFDVKTSLLVAIFHLVALRLSRRKNAKAQALTSIRHYVVEHRQIARLEHVERQGGARQQDCPTQGKDGEALRQLRG